MGRTDILRQASPWGMPARTVAIQVLQSGSGSFALLCISCTITSLRAIHQAVDVPSRLIDQPGAWQCPECPRLEQLPYRRHRFGIAVAGVIGRWGPASRVVSPAGRLQSDPIGIGKID